MVFVPNLAPLVVLAFLGTGFALFVGGLLLLHSALAGRADRARKIFVAAVAWVAMYGIVLVGASWFSEEKTLAVGEQKYFCEIDCHVAYSVEGVTTARTVGEGEAQATAAGTFYIVKLKTWFDEKTISSHRAKDMPLLPNPRWVFVEDSQSRRFFTSLAGLKALPEPAGRNVPLTQSLRPGESYETTLVFDLPSDVRNPRLMVTDPFPVNLVLIGHENSFFHKKVYFGLTPATTVSTHREP